MPRLEPLSREDMPEFEELFVSAEERGRQVPNLLRTLARKPEIVKALRHLRAVILAPGSLSEELKNMISQVASMSAGCNYCAAHTVGFGVEMGLPDDRMKALWDYETSELFTDAERAAFRVAQGSVQVPNLVTDEDFAELKEHFSDEQIVEILSVIGVFGFYNRVNDTLATELEASPIEAAQRYIADRGWTVGKHAGTGGPAAGGPAAIP